MAKIGAMRRKITLQSFTKTRNRMGGVIKAWIDVADVRAAVVRVTQKERWQGYKLEAEADYVIKIRYRADFDRNGRVKFADGTTCRIVSILNEDVKRRWLLVSAKEVDSSSAG